MFFPVKDVQSGVQKFEGPLWKVPRCYICVSYSYLSYMFLLLGLITLCVSVRVHAFLDGDPTGWYLRMELSPGSPDSECYIHGVYMLLTIAEVTAVLKCHV